MQLVAEAVRAADADQPLPDQLPKHVIPLFEGYGKTLKEDESFEQKPEGGQVAASYTRKSRERLLQFLFFITSFSLFISGFALFAPIQRRAGSLGVAGSLALLSSA